MRATHSLDAAERWWRWFRRGSWLDTAISVAIAAGAGYLISEVVTRPLRRTVVFAVGLAFAAGIYAAPSIVSLAVLVFLLPFGVTNKLGNSNIIFSLVLALLIILRRVRTPERLVPRTGVGVPMFLLLVVHLASLYNTRPEDRELAFVKVAALATGMVIFWLVVTVARDAKSLRMLVNATALAAGATCIVAAYEITHPGHSILPHFFYAPWAAREGMVRAVATFRNYSNFAQYMAMNLVLIGYLLLRSRSAVGRFALLVLLAAVAAVFLNTGMRGASLAIVVGGIYVVVYGRHALRFQQIGLVAAILAGAIGLGSYFMTRVAGFGTVFTRFSEYGLVSGSGEARKTIFLKMLSGVHEHILLGHGPAISVPENYVYRAVMASANPHNQYLYYLYTVGIVGLAIFLWFAARLFWQGHTTLVKTRAAEPFAYGLLAVLQGNLVLFLFHEMADDYMFSAISIHVTWFFFGLLAATIRVVRESGTRGTAGATS